MFSDLEKLADKQRLDLYQQMFGRLFVVVLVAACIICSLVYFEVPYGGLGVLFVLACTFLCCGGVSAAASDVVLQDGFLNVVAQVDFLACDALATFRQSLTDNGFSTLCELEVLISSEREARTRRERLNRPGAQAVMSLQTAKG